jgi:hypothetical protein
VAWAGRTLPVAGLAGAGLAGLIAGLAGFEGLLAPLSGRLAAGTPGAALRLSRPGVWSGLLFPWFVLLVMEWFCFSSQIKNIYLVKRMGIGTMRPSCLILCPLFMVNASC